MSKTHLQTVEILSPRTTLVHYSQELAPVAPEWVLQSEEHEAVEEPGRVVVWWKGGTCDVYLEDGTIKRFWPKPTLTHAVHSSTNGSYYRFHRDGTVEQVFEEMNFFWGPTTIEAPATSRRGLIVYAEVCMNRGFFDIYGNSVEFELLPGSYLASRSCECTNCYFEDRQRAYRKRVYESCDCALCRDSDEDF